MLHFTTSRLRLSPLTSADAPFFLELVNSPGWLQYIGDRNLHTNEEAIQYLQKGPILSYVEHGFGLLRVADIKENKAIGICGLIKRPDLENVDLGFAFLPAEMGKGYAYEASHVILEHVKATHSFSKILAITKADNAKSIALLLKLQFQYSEDITIKDELLSLYTLHIS